MWVVLLDGVMGALCVSGGGAARHFEADAAEKGPHPVPGRRPMPRRPQTSDRRTEARPAAQKAELSGLYSSHTTLHRHRAQTRWCCAITRPTYTTFSKLAGRKRRARSKNIDSARACS